MKVYISKNSVLKIASSKGVKVFHPFYIVNDEDIEDMSKLNGLEDIGTLFDLQQLNSMSQEINNKIDKFNENINTIKQAETKTKTLLDEASGNIHRLNKVAEVLDYTQACIDDTIERLITVTEIVEEIDLNGTEEAETFKSVINKESDRILNNLHTISKSFKEEITYKLKEMEAFYNTVNLTLDKKIKDFETKVERYDTEMKKMLELSKKWACNPANIPVEDGLFSAKHYAEKDREVRTVYIDKGKMPKSIFGIKIETGE